MSEQPSSAPSTPGEVIDGRPLEDHLVGRLTDLAVQDVIRRQWIGAAGGRFTLEENDDPYAQIVLVGVDGARFEVDYWINVRRLPQAGA